MKNGTLYVKLMLILFGQLLEKIGLHFSPTSGHTVDESSYLVDRGSAVKWTENETIFDFSFRYLST